MQHFIPFTIPIDLTEKAAAIDTARLSVADIGEAFSKGTFLPSELTAACLTRINQLEPYLNAFIWLNPNALDEARRADAEIGQGKQREPLHGIPIVLKDNMNIAGVRTTAGYAGFASDDRVVDSQLGAFNGIDLIPSVDAPLVSRLKAAGAIILGKSNLPDFGLDGLRANSSHAGDTLSPYDRRFAPGASSTGSAAAVATGMGIVSMGTDTAGSILFPASAQSLVGLKPSFGLVPAAGIFPGLANHDVTGPITRTVRDAAIVLDAIASSPSSAPRYADALRLGAFKGKRIGLFESGIWAGALHPAVEAHYLRMIQVIQELGAETVSVVFGDTDWQSRWSARKFFMNANCYLGGVDAYLAALGGDNPCSREDFKTRAGFDIGLGTTAPLHGVLANPEINFKIGSPEMNQVIEMANGLLISYERILSDKGIDALFMPRSINPLPDLTGHTPQYLGDQAVGTEVNELGLPAITVPAGFLDDGRPIGIDIVGRRLRSDSEILALAFDFEQKTLLRKKPAL
jgi:amidase